MIINSVKLLPDHRISISFSKPVNDSHFDSSINSPERAAPTFYAAINKLIPYAIKICELTEDLSIKILSVNFGRIGDDETLTVKIKFSIRLSNDEFIKITTPIRYADHANKKITDNQLMGEELENILVTVMDESIKYVNGEREQIKADI